MLQFFAELYVLQVLLQVLTHLACALGMSGERPVQESIHDEVSL